VTEQFRLLRDAWQQVESGLAGGSGKSATKYPAPPGETPGSSAVEARHWSA